ncbi:chitinase C-terminal domain-containing protein [Kitasatospora sp. NPDC098652]|uniref:chitinase C-terminal domain-containing protein n=1 Tax=Kitasatospora sp. NPDC098652 TaxID=3364095 RepID=UPI0037FF8DE5
MTVVTVLMAGGLSTVQPGVAHAAVSKTGYARNYAALMAYGIQYLTTWYRDPYRQVRGGTGYVYVPLRSLAPAGTADVSLIIRRSDLFIVGWYVHDGASVADWWNNRLSRNGRMYLLDNAAELPGMLLAGATVNTTPIRIPSHYVPLEQYAGLTRADMGLSQGEIERSVQALATIDQNDDASRRAAAQAILRFAYAYSEGLRFGSIQTEVENTIKDGGKTQDSRATNVDDTNKWSAMTKSVAKATADNSINWNQTMVDNADLRTLKRQPPGPPDGGGAGCAAPALASRTETAADSAACDAPITAAFSVADNQAYLFHAGEYASVEVNAGTANDAISGGPQGGIKSIYDNWPSLRGTRFVNGIDAGFSLANHKNEAYLFSGDQFARISVHPGAVDDTMLDGPKRIVDAFPVLKGTIFESGVDAAFSVRKGEAYLFKDGKYVLLWVDDKKAGDVRNVADNWPSLRGTPFAQHIDAAFSTTEWTRWWWFFQYVPGEAFLFSGNQYIRISVTPGTTDDKVLNGPLTICQGWNSLCGTPFDGGAQPATAEPLTWSGPTGRSIEAPTPAADPDPSAPAAWSTDPADQPKCRPDGMTPTQGVNTPYCLAYDDAGRELMGSSHPRRVIGYFAGWRTGRDGTPAYLPSNIPWGKVTHVNYAFAHVDPANRISVGPDSPDNPATGMEWPGVPGANLDPALPYKGNFNLLTTYKKQHPRVKSLISVGGWADTGGGSGPDGNRGGGFYTMTTNEDGSVNQAGIDTFAGSVVDFLRRYDFNGVDLDYEYPTALTQSGNPQDWAVADAGSRRKGLTAGYNALTRTLREKLDAAGAADHRYYLLTAASSASGYLVRGQENGQALQYLDFANAMTYDLHGSWNSYVGPQAPLYDDGKDNELAAAGIYNDADPNTKDYQKTGYFNLDWAYHYYRGALQPGRINLGVPYYTRGWQGVQGGTDGLWGTAPLPDQSKCQTGTGTRAPCGSGATGVDNLWHDNDAAGHEVGAGANPLWHAKNLERNLWPDYLTDYGLESDDPANRISGYTRHYDDTLQAAWLWNPDKKVFISTEDEKSVAAKADYLAATGAGGAVIWELSGDYSCPDTGQCGMGSTLTDLLSDKLKGAGPYGNTRTTHALPDKVVDVTAELVDYPTDAANMWPMQPKLRITNNTATTLPSGTELSFDIPTSTPPLLKDESWKEMKGAVTAGRTGPNVGGLKADFHRVTIKLGYCEDLPPGKSRDIGIKYYLPITGPANFTIKVGGTEYGLGQEHRKNTTTVTPDPGGTANAAACQADPWDARRTYNPAWAPFTLWKTGDKWLVEDVNSGNLLDHPGGWGTAHLVEKQAGNANQQWTVTEDGGAGWFRIKSGTGGHDQCLGADRLSSALSVRDCDGSPGQWWEFLDDKGNRVTGSPAHGTSYTLGSFAPGTTWASPDLVAEPRNSAVAPGTPIVAGDPSGITRAAVSYNGSYWKAKYWTKGNVPDATDAKNPWTRLGPTP